MIGMFGFKNKKSRFNKSIRGHHAYQEIVLYNQDNGYGGTGHDGVSREMSSRSIADHARPDLPQLRQGVLKLVGPK